MPTEQSVRLGDLLKLLPKRVAEASTPHLRGTPTPARRTESDETNQKPLYCLARVSAPAETADVGFRRSEQQCRALLPGSPRRRNRTKEFPPLARTIDSTNRSKYSRSTSRQHVALVAVRRRKTADRRLRALRPVDGQLPTRDLWRQRRTQP